MRRLFLSFVWLSTASCGASTPEPFAVEHAAARRAYAHGRYLEAAEHWARAETEADTPEDRDEASYRRAASLARAGKTEQAARTLKQLADQHPGGDRAARAMLDLARLHLDSEDEVAGHHWLERLIRAHPDSAPAARALSLHAAWLAKARPGSAAADLRDIAKRSAGTELEERARYEVARALEQTGALEASRDAYLRTAARFPYPTGAFWDDALWHAANIEARLARPRRAIELLQRLLAARETSSFQGSYERPRYGQARYRIGELYRGPLADPDQARQQFRLLWSEHPHSRLRDDAKWQEAVLSHRVGDRQSACRAAQELLAGAPQSRFAACAPLVCARLPKNREATCRRYIARTVAPTADD